jgi:hypothetical protein
MEEGMDIRHLLAAGAMTLAVAAVPASAVLVTFDNGDELSTQFVNPVSPATKIFVQETEGGLGAGPGSGSLRVSGLPPTGSDDNEATHTAAFNMVEGNTFTTSIMIKKAANGDATGTTRAFQIGFTTNPTIGTPFTNSTVFPNSFISTRINYAGIATGNYQMEIQHRISESGSVTNLIPAGGSTNAPTNLANSWFLFSVSIEYTDEDTGTFSVSAFLQDYGADGNTPGATVLSFAPTSITNGSLTGPRTVYGGIRSLGNALGDGSRFDNYSVDMVPEPAAAGLLAAGAMTLAVRRRRRA